MKRQLTITLILFILISSVTLTADLMLFEGNIPSEYEKFLLIKIMFLTQAPFILSIAGTIIEYTSYESYTWLWMMISLITGAFYSGSYYSIMLIVRHLSKKPLHKMNTPLRN